MAALFVLEKCRRNEAWSDAILGSVMNRENLHGADRGLCTALCYGVLQNRTWLDYAIGRFSTLPLRRVEPKVLDILRLSLYQLMFLHRIPAYAAVSQGVELCRAAGCIRAAGYVNAVLRRLAELDRMPEPEGSEAERLSIVSSHPQWLVEELTERLGKAEAEAFLLGNNAVPPVYLQTNTLNGSMQELIEELAEEGVETEPDALLPGCLKTWNPGDLTRTDAFQDGLFYVQDPAARMAVLIAAPKKRERVLDACAAPGGKSFAAAIASGNGARITASDIHENKLRRLQEGAKRLGLRIDIQAADARVPRAEWQGNFDLVIADVPCSGLGVIRKKPDIRWKDPLEFERLPKVQRAILDNLVHYLRPGGRLLYSTCTIRREENEDLVRAFLDETPKLRPVEFSTPYGDRSEDGMLQLWPQRQGTDGFFIAMMRKTP